MGLTPPGIRSMNRATNCVAICLLLFAPELVAASTNTWIATWGTSPQSGTPDPHEPLLNIENQTVRERVRVSIGGSQIRVRFSNEFGSSPLLIGAAARTDSTRATSRSSPQSFNLRIGRWTTAAAASAILTGVSRLTVNDVSTRSVIGTLASSQTRLPRRFASKSQSAQSTAFRAAPAGSNSGSLSRSKPTALARALICVKTDSVFCL